MKNKFTLRLLVCAFAFLVVTISSSSQASIINLSANIDGSQANAGIGSGSLGAGVANMLFDDVSNEFSWDISWSGLTGNVTAAHFHGAALPNQNAGVQVPISTLLSPTSGSANITGAQAADLLAGLWYINIHTDTSPGGEIRGQIVREQITDVSAPSMLSLVLLSMIGVFYSRRRIF
jgi:hypothetical protein